MTSATSVHWTISLGAAIDHRVIDFAGVFVPGIPRFGYRTAELTAKFSNGAL
jgi:hypothetical protein